MKKILLFFVFFPIVSFAQIEFIEATSNSTSDLFRGITSIKIRVPSDHTLAGSPTPARTLSTHPGGDKIAKFSASGTLTVS